MGTKGRGRQREAPPPTHGCCSPDQGLPEMALQQCPCLALCPVNPYSGSFNGLWSLEVSACSLFLSGQHEQ